MSWQKIELKTAFWIDYCLLFLTICKKNMPSCKRSAWLQVKPSVEEEDRRMCTLRDLLWRSTESLACDPIRAFTDPPAVRGLPTKGCCCGKPCQAHDLGYPGLSSCLTRMLLILSYTHILKINMAILQDASLRVCAMEGI